MVTVKRLKELIKDLPDDAKCFAYEGEDVGMVIYVGKDSLGQCKKSWFIRAGECQEETTYTEGFDKKEKK